MEEDVTVADESNCDAILSAAPKIQELFGVRVERVSRLDCVDGGVLFKTSDVSGPSSSLRSSDGPTPPDQQKGSDAVSGVMIYPVAGDGVTLDSVNRAKVCTLVNTNCVLVSHAVEKGARLQVGVTSGFHVCQANGRRWQSFVVTASSMTVSGRLLSKSWL